MMDIAQLVADELGFSYLGANVVMRVSENPIINGTLLDIGCQFDGKCPAVGLVGKFRINELEGRHMM